MHKIQYTHQIKHIFVWWMELNQKMNRQSLIRISIRKKPCAQVSIYDVFPAVTTRRTNHGLISTLNANCFCEIIIVLFVILTICLLVSVYAILDNSNNYWYIGYHLSDSPTNTVDDNDDATVIETLNQTCCFKQQRMKVKSFFKRKSPKWKCWKSYLKCWKSYLKFPVLTVRNAITNRDLPSTKLKKP